MYEGDTIAAIATPAGTGGIGIVRVSGPLAPRIADAIFRRRRHSAGWQSHRLYHGQMTTGAGLVIDDGLAVVMRAPHSYTGEDVLELHCHGSPAVLRVALEAALRHGARPAQKGEFTKRAFLNGKIELTQAEAVADVVQARTAESASQAAEQLCGHLARHLESLRQRLVRAKAHLEVQIDFVDEDVDLDSEAVRVALDSVQQAVDTLLATYERGRILREGLQVAIAGRPNAGKSSLLNALLGEDRAIVTPIPGTTRDVIEEAADFLGVGVVLSDTAGIRATPNEIERIGVERAHGLVAAADVTLLVIDQSVAPEPPIVPVGPRVLPLLNKIDLPSQWSRDDVANLLGESVIRVSAATSEGLDDLRRAVVVHTGSAPRDGTPVLTRSRQRDALLKTRDALAAALDGVSANAAPELVAVDVQAALDHIGSVTGAVTSEDVLDAIFAEFCLGK
jgi:tRNA modification GTPase